MNTTPDTTMDTQVMKELLLKAHDLAGTDELKSLVEDLQDFLTIQEARSAAPANEELTTKWLAARDRLWTNFDSLTTEYGITPEVIRAQLKSSDMFSGEHQELYTKIQKEANKK